MEWGAATLEARVVEMSAGGIFVEMADPLWVGARFLAQIGLEAPVKIECEVRRVEPLRGMALTYSVRDEQGRAAVSAFLAKLGG